MKKILATLSIIFCLAFAITGLGGCSGCSSTDETGNGGQILLIDYFLYSRPPPNQFLICRLFYAIL